MGLGQRIVGVREPSMVGAIWAICAWASIVLTEEPGRLATVWPANAVLLVALLARPTRSWPPFIAATWVAGIIVNLLVGSRGLPVPGLALINAGEAGFAALLIRKFIPRGPLFESTSGTIGFIIACLVAGGCAATASGLLLLFDGRPLLASWIGWFAADTLGLLIMTPLLMIGRDLLRDREWARRDWPQGATILGVVAAVACLVFGQTGLPLLFLLFPPLLFATYRLSGLGAAASTLIVALIGSYATLHGRGPVALTNLVLEDRILFFQAFLAVSFLTVLPAAALLAERDMLARAARASDERLREAAQAAAAYASRLAATDELTGLANRREFMRRLEEEYVRASGYGTPLALAIFDIDHFKHVNDRHGHGGGDAVLRAIAASAIGVVRAGDLVARLGGEEFAVLMPGAPADAARSLSERLRLTVEHLRCAEDIAVTVSVGLAMFRAGMSADELLVAADRALYAAKADGRNLLRLAA
jgi:diguanylate cyclase (GGDEF)-like protein